MRVERKRLNVFTVTATGQELSALIAAARMMSEMMAEDPGAPAEAVALLQRVLRDYDVALERFQEEDGRAGRPSSDSS